MHQAMAEALASDFMSQKPIHKGTLQPQRFSGDNLHWAAAEEDLQKGCSSLFLRLFAFDCVCSSLFSFVRVCVRLSAFRPEICIFFGCVPRAFVCVCLRL